MLLIKERYDKIRDIIAGSKTYTDMLLDLTDGILTEDKKQYGADIAFALVYAICISKNNNYIMNVQNFATLITREVFNDDLKEALDYIEKDNKYFAIRKNTNNNLYVKMLITTDEIDSLNEQIKDRINDLPRKYKSKYKLSMLNSPYEHEEHIFDRDFLKSLQKMSDTKCMLNEFLLNKVDEVNTFKFRKNDNLKDKLLILKEQVNISKQCYKYIKKNYNNRFYFNVSLDTRGRAYYDGYQINPQSYPYKKYVIDLFPKGVDKGKAVAELHIDMFNAYHGFTTYNREEKLAKMNFTSIKKYSDNVTLDINRAKDPILFLKAKEELKNIIAGNHSSYVCYRDATSSGVQILSALLYDFKAAKLTNLIDNSKKYDFYDYIARELTRETGIKYTRKEIKKPVMTHFYNSQENPRTTLGDHYDVMLRILDEQFPKLQGFMKACKDIWDENATFHKWIMPDGFVAKVPVKNSTTYDVSLRQGNFKYIHNTVGERGDKNYRSLAPNIVQSIDAYIARTIIRRANFPIIQIFDNFGCHLDNVKKMKKLYIGIIRDMAKECVLIKLINQISHRKYDTMLNKNDINLISSIDSTYAID